MSTENPDVPMAVHAAREGDGYWKSKGEQWQLMCGHMSSTAKIALGILCSLTGQTHPVRRLTAAELAGLLSKAPVAPGEDPKGMSTSGAIRVLRELADLGQLTRPDGTRLTISSRPTAELSVCVWKRPRHDCGCARNVHDALAMLRGEARWFPPASAGENSDQTPVPGQNSHQAGENSDQAGQNSAKTPPLTCDEAPPLSLSPSSPSLSEGSAVTSVTAESAEAVTEERESGAAREDDAGHASASLPGQRAHDEQDVGAGQDHATSEFVATLPGRLGKASVRRLAPLVAAAFAEGYTSETLRAELARQVNVSRVHTPRAIPGLYASALGDLPPAPTGSASEAPAGGRSCPDGKCDGSGITYRPDDELQLEPLRCTCRSRAAA
ncbi:hypothetical protein [Streptomyces sp. TR06-5]|uniref:hypothetical protein n=1 Tax=Streptomyces sp. TR06-5 TaxID=3385976 RepID=UPI0039A32400